MHHILFIVTQSSWGGAQQYIHDLASHLPSEEFKVSVAAGGNGKLLHSFNSNKITTYSLQNLVRDVNPIKDIKAIKELKKLLSLVQPDIVHLNSSKAGVVGALAARHFPQCKVVYTAHGFVFNEPMNWLKKQVYIQLERASARYEDAIITVSEFDKKVALKHHIAPEKKITSIHNGITQPVFFSKQDARSKLNIAQDARVIMTIGNFYSTKGYRYLLDAARQVTTKNKNAIFVIVGHEGPERKAIEKMISDNHLDQSVRVVSHLATRASQYLLAADLYVCSSVKEGLPYTVMQAMAAGLPIITTNVGGITEMIIDGESGMVCEPKNAARLAEKISQLLEAHNKKALLGTSAKQRFEQLFSLEKMVKSTIKLYSSL